MIEHLTCKVCGYKQWDRGTVDCFKRMCPEMEAHDIPYKCGACIDYEEA